MPVVGQNLQESQIFQQSVEGLKEVLGASFSDYGKPPIPVVAVPNDWAQRELYEQKGEVIYPYMAITLQHGNRNNDSYNDNLRRGGIYVAHPDSNKVIIYRLIPVVANFRIRFYTQSFNETLSFFSRWMLRQKDIQFWLTTAGFRFRIKVMLEEDFPVPPQDNTDYGQIFTIETSLNMQSYVGEMEVRRKITQVVMTTNLWSNNKPRQVLVENTQTIDLRDTEANPPNPDDPTQGGTYTTTL